MVSKTYDPVSGTTLKYKTNKAADVTRLITSLGRLGRNMAALPESLEIIMDDAPEVHEESTMPTSASINVKPLPTTATAKPGGAPPTGKKGKKKGKK